MGKLKSNGIVADAGNVSMMKVGESRSVRTIRTGYGKNQTAQTAARDAKIEICNISLSAEIGNSRIEHLNPYAQ
jgi:hypothetical protein